MGRGSRYWVLALPLLPIYELLPVTSRHLNPLFGLFQLLWTIGVHRVNSMAIMVVSIALVLIFCYLYATSGTRSDSGAYGSSYYSETYQSSTGSYAGSYGSSYYADTYQSGIGSYSGAYGSSYYANTYDHSPNFRPYTEERSLTDAPESNIGYSPPSITKRPSRFRNIQNVLSRSRTADETVTRTRRMIVSTFVKSTLRQKSAKQKDGKVRKRIVKKRGPWDGCVGSIEEKECVVCTEDKAVAEFPKQLTPQCTHTTDICKICIDRWIATQMEQGTVPIKCIDQACQGRLDHKGIRLLMKEDTLQRYVCLVWLCHWLAYVVVNCHTQIRQSPQEYGTKRLA